MFGLLQPCRHVLDDDLRDQWRAHLCGLCLSLRDGHGQTARLTTNTDTVMVSVLTAAQRAPDAVTRTAGPCPLRGMRRAEVVTAAEPGIRLATSASLTLAAAKAHDTVAEQQYALAPSTPTRRRAVGFAERALTRKAQRTGDVLDVIAVLRALDPQAQVEASGADLDALTAPTAQACSAVFASSADLAGAPENRELLAAIGADYGRLAHLLDAIDDRESDAADGAFNSLTATGTTDEDALDTATMLSDRIARRYADLALHDGRLLKALLVDGVAQAVRRRRHRPARDAIAAIADGRTTWPDEKPVTWPDGWPYPPPFPPNRRTHERILPYLGVNLCGPALFTDHWNHCSDDYRPSACDDCDCCCDCHECGNCCSCDDCCCDDCDCDCDCSC